MRRLLRSVRLVAAIAIAAAAGTLPACGSMGGGMHYFIDPPALAIT
jgi:hypothetical protein